MKRLSALLLWLALWATPTLEAAPADLDAEPRTLRVATRHVPPFAMLQDGVWQGIAIELWRRIGAELGYRSEFLEMDLGAMLEAVERGRVEAAVAALTITSEREARLDFSHSFHSSGLGIAVQRNPGTRWMDILKRLFSANFLNAIAPLLLLLTLSGVLVWLAERRRNPQFPDGAAEGIGAGLWWSAVTMTTVGYGDKAPQTPVGRLIALVWMFASVITISGFTAAITTALTMDRLTQTVSGIEDLYQARVLTQPDSTSAAFLDAHLVRYAEVANLPTALAALDRGEADAVIYDTPLLRHLVAADYANRLTVLPRLLQRQDYGIALPSGSPLREDINRELLRIIRSPDWQQLLYQYLGHDR